MANLFSVKQTLRWGLACRIFIMQCFLGLTPVKRKEQKQDWGEEEVRLWQFYSKAFASLTRSSGAERGPHSCPEWGVMAFTPLGGPDVGSEEQERARDFGCSNSFETRCYLEGLTVKAPVQAVGVVSSSVLKGTWVVQYRTPYQDSAGGHPI